VEEWVKAGTITREEARIHSARHGLTMALGVDDDIEPVLGCLPWNDNGCMLLCSDGLTEMLDEHTMAEIVQSSRDPDEACQMLVDRANAAGGIDNITVILVCEDHGTQNTNSHGEKRHNEP
jgi:protein phosphatase